MARAKPAVIFPLAERHRSLASALLGDKSITVSQQLCTVVMQPRRALVDQHFSPVCVSKLSQAVLGFYAHFTLSMWLAGASRTAYLMFLRSTFFFTSLGPNFLENGSQPSLKG